MIQLSEILVADGIGAVLMLVVIRHFGRNSRSRLLGDALFMLMAYLTGALCVLEAAAFLIDGRLFPLAVPVNYVLNMLLFTCSVLFSYTWTLYSDYRLFGSRERLRKRGPWIALPGFAMIGVILSTPITDAVFTISPENVYARSSFLYPVYLLTYGYLICGGLNVYLNRRKVVRYVFIPVSTFVLPIIVGSTVQFLCYGLATQWVSVAVGVISLYVNMQSESMYVDSLSGLYNRLYVDSYLKSECGRIGKGKRLVGIMLDVDRFKQINDMQGHLMGDRAIQSAGQILRETIRGYDAFAARYGGDEFMILARFEKGQDAAVLTDAVHRCAEAFNAEEGEPYALSFSAGITEYIPGQDDVDSFLSRMDRSMYEMKSEKQRA